MQQGEIVEKGTHSELMDNRGVYYNLVAMQSLQT
jgi:ABC-type multidrug transport system fused ATPase/permease subunit